MTKLTWCVTLVAVLATAARAERYTWVFERLEPIPGTDGAFTPSINNAGEAGGDSYAGSTRIPTVWGTDGTPLEAFVTTRRAFVREVNDSGDVGGFFFGPRVPFRTRNGVVEELEGLFGPNLSIATAMNNAGVLVGNSFPVLGESIGTVWDLDGTAISIGTFGGTSSNAQDISDNGLVTGFAQHADGRWEAYRWNPRTQTKQGLGILPLPGYDVSWGTGINKRGQVVGFSNDAGSGFGFNAANTQAFFWTPSNGLTQLQVPGSPAYVGAADLNDSGLIVGNYHPTSLQDGLHPCMWRPDGTFVDLTPVFPAGTTRARTADISHTGWIAGWYTDPVDGREYGFRLRPVPVPADEQIEDLRDRVRGLDLDENRELVLTRLLDAALECLDDERPARAAAKLRVFRVIVRAWQGRHLDEADARSLRYDAWCALKAIDE